MANVGRYTYCPMAGKIKRDTPNPLRWLRKRFSRREAYPLHIVDFWPACYPTKNDR